VSLGKGRGRLGFPGDTLFFYSVQVLVSDTILIKMQSFFIGYTEIFQSSTILQFSRHDIKICACVSRNE